MGDSTLENYFQIQIAQRLELDVMRSIYSFRDFVVKNRHLMDRSALLSVATVCSLRKGLDAEIERVRIIRISSEQIFFVFCCNT